MSHPTRYLLIGGGPAAVSAAQAIRERDDAGEITLVTADRHLPYDRPPLSKDFLTDPEMTPEDILTKDREFYEERRIEVRTGVRIVDVDTVEHRAASAAGEVFPYDRCLIATGATSRTLAIPGATADNVHLLRSVDESIRLRAAMAVARRALIVGGGWIGVEVAGACLARGLEVTLISREARLWERNASETVSDYVRRYLAGRGARFHFEEEVEELRRGDDGANVARLRSGTVVPYDFALVAVGAKLKIDLPRQAGLALHEQEGVYASEFMASSVHDVYVAGDIAYFNDPVLGRRWHSEHHLHAKVTGKVAGANMAGDVTAYDEVPWYFSDVQELHMQMVGDPTGWTRSFTHGGPSTRRFVELYQDDGGALVMAQLVSPTEEEDECMELIEKLVRARPNITGREQQVASGQVELAGLLS
jgi:3-phenylpropionate/trans-cinnamate dioxygenase ferredoxin reductase component